MERELFTWKNWTQFDTSGFGFHDCELIKDIGNYKTGEFFSSIFIDYNKGEMRLYKNLTDQNPVATFQLRLSVYSKLV